MQQRGEMFILKCTLWVESVGSNNVHVCRNKEIIEVDLYISCDLVILQHNTAWIFINQSSTS